MTLSTFKTYRSLLTAALFTASSLLGAGSASAQDESLLQRVQALEDRAAIEDLIERFFEYQETGNRVEYANLFSQNGELILRMGHTTGGPAGILAPRGGENPAPVAAPAATRAPAVPAVPTEPTRHVLSNIHIELNGDTATAVSRWTMLVPLEERNRFRLGGGGTYCDKLIRENGEWKFLQRVIYCEIPEGMTPVN